MAKKFKTFIDFVYYGGYFEEGDFPISFTEETLHSDIADVLAMAKNAADLNIIRESFLKNDSDFEKYAKKVLLLDWNSSGTLRFLMANAPDLEYGDFETAKEKAWEYAIVAGLPDSLRSFFDIEAYMQELQTGGDWAELDGTYIFNANAF